MPGNLWEVAASGDLAALKEEIETLQENGSIQEINARNKEGLTPLHLAAEHGHYPCLELLLQHGADVNDVGHPDMQLTPLHLAVMSNFFNGARLLLEYQANPNAPDIMGSTPLHLAVMKGLSDCIRLLILSGANINARDSSEMTALNLAAGQGKLACLGELIRVGANVNEVGNHRRLLDFAAAGRHTDCIDVLAVHKADVNAVDPKNHPLLYIAVQQGWLQSAEALVRHGADVNGRGGDGKTIVALAIEKLNEAGQIEQENRQVYVEAYQAMIIYLYRAGAYFQKDTLPPSSPFTVARLSSLQDRADFPLLQEMAKLVLLCGNRRRDQGNPFPVDTLFTIFEFLTPQDARHMKRPIPRTAVNQATGGLALEGAVLEGLPFP